MSDFDYEKKVWGAPPVKALPWYIQGLKLQYTLNDLHGIHGKVLDIGCGAGNMIKAIKEERPDLTCYGIDISHAAITVAKKDPRGVIFQTGPAEKLPYPKNSFNAVIMYDVLEHLHHPEKALQEVGRVLKGNGMIHIFSPIDAQPGTLYQLIYKLGWQPKNKHTGHVQVFTSTSFEKLLNKEGFMVIKKRFSFHYIISFFDIIYFSLLELFHFEPPASIEGMIKEKEYSLFTKLFNIFYRCIIIVSFVESKLLWWFPAAGGVSLAIKKKSL